MDAVEAHLKYLMHVMFSCVLRKLWKIREYPLSLQTPNVHSGLQTLHSSLALESNPFMFSCFQQLNTASGTYNSLKTQTVFPLSRSYTETVSVTALGLN